ncbi:MAG: ABC transporter permease [Chloroflexota bacterium]|nr:ABC transporter permease [Chloroflexota bacterium]
MSAVVLERQTFGMRARGMGRSTADFFRLLSARKAGLIGFAGVAFFTLMTLLGPVFVKAQTNFDVTSIYLPPSSTHLLGTDFQGRDVLAQIINGGRDILVVAALAALFSTLIAVGLGAFSATVGGWVDTAIVAFTDVVLTIPQLPVLVVVAAVVKPSSFIVLAVLLALLSWAGLLRQVRAQVLSLKERDFVEAARSLDLGIPHIVFREILPLMRSYIVIHFILAMTGAIYAQTALIVLGLVPLSGQNWGIMIYFADSQGALYFQNAFWYVMSPILAIVLFQLSLVMLVSALEDIFNPQLRAAA